MNLVLFFLEVHHIVLTTLVGLLVSDHNHLFFDTFCFQKTTNLGHVIFLGF